MTGLALLLVLAAGGVDASFTADERALLAEVDAEHLIKARELAEKILATRPDSFAATWAMARVYHDEEGNHARALFYVKRAEALLGDGDREWGRKLLIEEYWTVEEMNLSAESLEVLDRLERRFGAAPSGLRVWPLMKLGRHEEAEAIARRLTKSEDPEDRSDGYNDLLSIADEQHDRAKSYRWAMDGVRDAQDRGCVLLRNAGGVAYSNFRLAQAEELMTRATKPNDCPSSVYNDLAVLYLVEGDLQKALAALASARAQPVEKRMRPQFALVRRAVLVDLLLVMGKGADAVRLAAELYAQPARTGMVSSSPSFERLGRTTRYAFALDAQLTQLREQASYAKLPAGPAAVVGEVAGLLATRWEVRRAILQLLAEQDLLVLLARPNLISESYTWRLADLAEIAGTGVLKAAVTRARAIDAAFPEATAYFDAVDGELAFRSGDLQQAVALAESAVKGLPREEALLRWRTRAWEADALRRLGRAADAHAAYGEVLNRWPTALRILGLALPVTLASDGSELGRETAARLGRSVRFAVAAQAPFALRVEQRGGSVEICLRDDAGAQLTCASGADATAALDAFHDAAFSPKVSLTQSDLRSLDGSPVRVGADEALKAVLGP